LIDPTAKKIFKENQKRSHGLRIYSKSMNGYQLKLEDIQMDINKSMDNLRLISIKKHVYPFKDIYCLRISIAECPCINIPAWISMWISILIWIIDD